MAGVGLKAWLVGRDLLGVWGYTPPLFVMIQPLHSAAVASDTASSDMAVRGAAGVTR